ncbi:hypothetical protein RBB84_25030 (plasmid) [Rhodococcus sp. D-6]|uniref:Uncharacterized protein n=1 Tax=Rhodococcus sp. D-6 TaxID=1387842 RepID=A0AAU7V486_9NOCA
MTRISAASPIAELSRSRLTFGRSSRTQETRTSGFHRVVSQIRSTTAAALSVIGAGSLALS